MERFVKGEKCLKLFKEKGNLLDIDRARRKRFAQSGCVNRFSVVDGDDIGDLSADSFTKIGKVCYTRSDKKYLDFLLSTGQRAPFTGDVLLPADVQKLEKLPLPARLGKTIGSPKTKISALRAFASTVGVGLPLVSQIQGKGKDGYVYLKTFSLLFSLEREGLVWTPRIQTQSRGKYFGKYIEARSDEFCYPKDMVSEMKKIKTLPSKTRYVVVPVIVDAGGHANTMVIDRKTKKVSFFEPYGMELGGKHIKSQRKFVEHFIQVFGLRGYSFIETAENCPWFGPQSIETRILHKTGAMTGYCETWSNLFVYCKIKFPDLSDAEIHYGLTHGASPAQLRDLVERFAAFAQNEGKKATKNFPEFQSPSKAFLYFDNPFRNVVNVCQKF